MLFEQEFRMALITPAPLTNKESRKNYIAIGNNFSKLT